jgi:hypothetical protein
MVAYSEWLCVTESVGCHWIHCQLGVTITLTTVSLVLVQHRENNLSQLSRSAMIMYLISLDIAAPTA